MTNEKIRLYRLDGDELEVVFVYDEQSGRHFGDYPDFTENPRHTPKGRPWVNVMTEGCPFADDDYGDCGSCPHFLSEQQGDLIGICKNDELRVKNSERKM